MLNKKASFLVFLLFVPLFAFSQYFKGGVVAGLSASQVDGDTYFGFNKLGLLGGGWVRWMFTDDVSGQLELRYIMKGAYAVDNVNKPYYLYKLVLHYVDVPVIINYHYRERVLFQLGLSPEFLVLNREYDANGVTPEDAPPFHLLNLSAIGGISYVFLERFAANVRYNYSVLPIRAHASGQTYLLNRGQYNNVLTFSIYYQISRQ
jgi:hypothetical protein